MTFCTLTSLMLQHNYMDVNKYINKSPNGTPLYGRPVFRYIRQFCSQCYEAHIDESCDVSL